MNFSPRLIGKPVVVLSNNDGCVITRSEEATLLGIAVGAPTSRTKRFLGGIAYIHGGNSTTERILWQQEEAVELAATDAIPVAFDIPDD